MKNIAVNPGKARIGSAVLVLAVAIALGSIGCQKDDLMPTDKSMTNNSNKNSAAGNSGATASNVLTGNRSGTGLGGYVMISIDHFAGMSQLPDYSVRIYNDGLIEYEGRRNVKTEGVKMFRSPDIIMPVLLEIFEKYEFYEIAPGFTVAPDMPVVLTTLQVNEEGVPYTIYDNSFDSPQKLIQIRTSIENLLGIDRFVSRKLDELPSRQLDPVL